MEEMKSAHERVNDAVDVSFSVELFEVVIVNLHHRRGAATGEALDFAEGKSTVFGGFTDANAELLLKVVHQVVRAHDGARDADAYLNVVLANRALVVHRVERCDGEHLRFS